MVYSFKNTKKSLWTTNRIFLVCIPLSSIKRSTSYIETMGLFYENVEKVIVLFLFLIDYNNVGCLEMLGVGGPDWVHRYKKNNSLFIKISHFTLIDIIKKQIGNGKSTIWLYSVNYVFYLIFDCAVSLKGILPS